MLLRTNCPLLLLTSGLGVLACGSGLRSATSYSGCSEPVLAAPAQVREVTSLPAGYESIGEVSAECRITEGRRTFDGAWLSDVDCGEERLVRALRERAAEVGGELLVGRDCGSRIHRRAEQEYDVRCRAAVARPEPETLARRSPDFRPDGAEPGLPSDQRPVASEAWRILVDFSPDVRVEQRPPRRAEHVYELASLPPSHVRLGDVVTRCEQGCTEDAVREGLLTVAGRAGASSVVDVRCVNRGQGFVCMATAAGYEVDPERNPDAR